MPLKKTFPIITLIRSLISGIKIWKKCVLDLMKYSSWTNLEEEIQFFLTSFRNVLNCMWLIKEMLK